MRGEVGASIATLDKLQSKAINRENPTHNLIVFRLYPWCVRERVERFI